MFKANTLPNKDMSNYLFLGADIHRNNHTFLALNHLQQRVGQCLTTDSKEDLNSLRDWIEELKNNFESQVILGLEDSNGNGETVARFLISCGYQVYGVNPCLTAQRRERTIHQDKSDEKDALLVTRTLISELDNLPQIKINEQIQRAEGLKGVVDDYDALVKTQTQLKNQLHKVLYQEYGTEYHRLFKDPFSKKALKYWLNQNERDYKSLDPDFGLAVISSQLENIRKLRIKQKVEQLIFLKERIKYLVRIMKELFLHLPYQNLLTLPGCGILLASRIVAEIKDINKFDSSSKLAKYSGISPRENSSGQSKKYKRSKSGNRQLNKAFYRIALSQIGNRSKNNQFIDYYKKKIKEGKSKKQALRLLARKNVDIIYAMMRDNTNYLEKKT